MKKESLFKSRKGQVFLAIFVVAAILLYFQFIDGGVWQNVMVWSAAIYVGGNIGEGVVNSNLTEEKVGIMKQQKETLTQSRKGQVFLILFGVSTLLLVLRAIPDGVWGEAAYFSALIYTGGNVGEYFVKKRQDK